MNTPRSFIGVLAASALAVAGLANARGEAVNTLEIVVGNGPHAGTYKPADIICMHLTAQKRFSASFRNFDAPIPNVVGEGGISVDNPDDVGAKWGDVMVSFGERDKHPMVYSVSIPRAAKEAITMTKNGKETDLTFQGQTKDGIRIRVAARCLQTDEF